MGDLVFVIDNDIIKSGIDREAYTVMDIDDKVTCANEPDTPENRVKIILRTKKNLIGEYSNYSSAYHNKVPRSEEQRKKYEKNVDIISVLTGKSIDYAKTGIIYSMPRFISKYGRPLPYFMKYVSPYYARQKLSRANSNLNRLCWELEKWNKYMSWSKPREFDYRIMLSDDHPYTDEQFAAIENIYIKFNRQTSELVKIQDVKMSQLVCDIELMQYILVSDRDRADIFWSKYYSNIREECLRVCPDVQSAANIAVKLSYEKYKNRGSKFMWRILSAGVVKNISDTNAPLPIRDECGNSLYLGKRYYFNTGGM